MKKLFSLLIILSAVILLFTGCDDILNAAYPEYDPNSDEGGWIGDRSIQVYIDIDDSGDIDVTSNPFRVALVRMWENNFGGFDPDYDSLIVYDFWLDNNSDASINTNLPWLSDNAYMVFAWYDLENNGRPDYNEPATQLTWFNDRTWDYEDLFDFRWDDTREYYNAEGWLNDYSRLSVDIVDEFAYALGGDIGTSIDASFHIDGPDYIDPDYAYTESYRIIPNSVDIQYLRSFYWELQDQDRTWILTGNGGDYNYGSFDWNSNYFNVDYTSFDFQNYIDSTNTTGLVLQVTADFDDPSTPDSSAAELTWQSKLIINIPQSENDFDPGFSIEGRDSFPKDVVIDNHDYIVYPNSDVGIQELKWRVTDAWNNPVYYNDPSDTDSSYYEWTYVGGGSDTMTIDFDSLEYMFDDGYWTSKAGLYLEVEVTYDNTETSISNRSIWINLLESEVSDGGRYDLITNVILDSSYAGYTVDLWFYNDNDYYAYRMIDLNNFGSGTSIYWDYEDPQNQNQKVEAYLLTPDGYLVGGYDFEVEDEQYSTFGEYSITLTESDFLYGDDLPY